MWQNILTNTDVWEKLKNIEDHCHRISFSKGLETWQIPLSPGRDVEIRPIRELPPKKGLSFRDGQGRLLHDLASIELQAMELGVRSLMEFPDAPPEFRDRLTAVTLEEAKHLRLCLNALIDLGLPWGSYPTHLGLWQCVSNDDDLLDRIVIVHRYLEGAGLDASNQLLNRLSGLQTGPVERVVRVIAHDELAHVQFGSHWYAAICRLQKLDPDTDFRPRLQRLLHRIPRRLEKINGELRKSAGFSDAEISALHEVREHWLSPQAERIHPVLEPAIDPLEDDRASNRRPEHA